MMLVKKALCRVERAYLLRRGVHRFCVELEYGSVSLRGITEVWLGWGNNLYSASPDVLFELVVRSQTLREQTIVEFGGGVSTLLLGLAARKSGTKLISIEHDEAWCAHLRRVASRYSLGQVEVRHAPLVAFDGYDWYRLSALEGLGDVGLVFCDGPPGHTRGGRVGIVEHLAARLPRSAIVVLDDSNRPRESEISQRWASEQRLLRRSFQAHHARGFDVLSDPSSDVA